MPALPLSSTQRRALRADAHHLDPVVLIGQEGLTDAVMNEMETALSAHGLIKVRMFSDDRATRQAALETVADRLSAAPVQHIGKLLVLWRPVPDAPKPAREERQPGPRIVKIVSFSKSGNHRATVKKVKVLGNERVTRGGQIKRRELRQTSVKKKSQT